MTAVDAGRNDRVRAGARRRVGAVGLHRRRRRAGVAVHAARARAARATTGSASHVVLDERSAAFRALGIGARDRPARDRVLHVRDRRGQLPSGGDRGRTRAGAAASCARPTAHPSCATRARARRSTRRTSTASAVRWFHDPGPPEADAGAPVRRGGRSRAARSRQPSGRRPGPVHLNLPFREPLVPTGAPLVDAPGRPDGAPWTQTLHASRGASTPRSSSDSRRLVRAHPTRSAGRGMGRRVRRRDARPRFAARGGLAGARRSDLATPRRTARDLDLRGAAARARVRRRRTGPTVVLRIGAPLTSKVATAWLDAAVAADRSSTRTAAWLDPHPRTQVERIADRRRAAARRDRRGTRAVRSRAIDRPVARRLARSRARGPRRDRRRARRTRTRRSKAWSRATSRPRFPTAPRWSSRRACRCARSSGAWRRATACACSRTAARTASTASCRRWSGVAATAAVRPSACAATSASCTTPTGCSGRREAGTDVRGRRQRRRRHLLVPPARRSCRSSSSSSGRRTASTWSRSRARTGRPPSASTTLDELAGRARPPAMRACSSFPSTARRASPAIASCGRPSRPPLPR